MLVVAFSLPAAAQSDIASKLGQHIRTGRANQPHSSVTAGTALAVVDAPMDKVRDVITNYANYPAFMPHFSKSKILSARGSRALIYMEASLAKGAYTLWAQLKTSTKSKDDGTSSIDVKFVEGNMDHFSAHWDLEPIAGGEKTLIRFRIHVEPSLPLPSSLYSRQNEKAAKKTLKAIRSEVRKS